MRAFLFTTLAICATIPVTVQAQATRNTLPAAQPVVVSPSMVQHDYFPVLFSTEAPAPGSGSYREFLMERKKELYDHYQPTGQRIATGDAAAPEVLTGFQGNPYNFSVPNDNDVAISNDGMIVSVINSTINIYTETGEELYAVSLSAFSDTLDILESDFDPRVKYDPIHDRFVLVFLNGFDPLTSYIIVAFSQTNDPAGLWNLYALPGNPKDNDRWTDYPMIALTEGELFLTGNLIIPGEPWQTGFSETLIWQMSLDEGYSGADLNAIFWDDVFYGGAPIRNIHPVQGGSTPYGPDIYMLSNRNFSESNDSIFIVHVSGTLDDPGTTVTVELGLTDLPYGVPPVARQYNNHEFDTNDGRILGSFMENGQIQFVSNTLDPTTGFCGIYHGIITDLDGDYSIHGYIIGDDTMDLGYPNVSYTGRYDNDNQSIITFDHTAPEVFAGMSGIFYNDGNYSELVNIHTGDSYVNILSGYYERWGDYTGSQRKYNEPGVIWVSGNFGREVDLGPFTNRENATWVASLRTNDSLPLALESDREPVFTNVYPNPVQTWFQLDLELTQNAVLGFSVLDVNGKLVDELLYGEGKTGNNTFRFSTASLPAGIYFLQITANGSLWRTERIVKQ